MRSPLRRAAHFVVMLIAAAMVLAGCAFQKAMSRGEAAMAAGNYDSAVHHFTRAVSLDPDDAEARQRLSEAKNAAVGVRLGGARESLRAGDLVAAARAMGEALELMPGDPQAEALAGEVRASVVATGRANVAAGHFADARQLYADVLAVLPDKNGVLVAADDDATGLWIAHLAARRDAAAKANRLGDALLHHRMIVELAPTAVDRVRCQQLVEGLRPRHEVVFAPRLLVGGAGGDRAGRGGDSPERRFEALAEGLAGASQTQWLRVLRPGDAIPKGLAPPVLAMSIDDLRFDTRQDVETRTAEYQSGTRPVPNPQRHYKEDEVRQQERRVLDTEQDVTRAERDADDARADVEREGPTPDRTTSAEQRLDDARRRLDDFRERLTNERRQLQNRRDELAQIPPFVLEPVFSTHSFEVRHYRVRGSASLTSVVDWPAREGAPVTVPLAVEAADEAWAPQPIIGLPADPVTLPTEGQLRATLFQQATAELQRVIQQAFAEARAALRKRALALDGDPRVDLLVAYTLMDPALDDPEVDALLWEMRGIANASVLLDTCGL